ncbi:DUF1631 domain-containing protein [Dasania sp. GY-MA-18]|uniref:DUF1631 domain-containing protein n=1 Tax=Dasania phycosphaerae TaxID=2950436 RepID=A0A9J6RPR0_9GAMM|nr:MULTISPECIES: DUF1631 domain-containing protein [Dasania]MCR8924129.1 DUF1631 domain-containing protein [Dasania sp. GY-MA-18]MCZ0866702.1 DUF1631 domain-containing protein [Dasania phycosphaerae]MCZ0870287.1 DUF1631 domain-containing protein [Dasania phycosphaerae]
MKNKNDHIRLTGSNGNKASIPAPVTLVKNSAKSILMHCLENLFNSCDDLFFDLSSRATSNTEQNLYFESMRELRIKKAGALSSFSRKVEEHFDALNQPGNTAPKAPPKEPRGDSLSLVQDDDIERDVAINSMVSKARGSNQEALYHLQVRLDYLTNNRSIDSDNNPLDPQQLCNNFADVCELFDIHIKAKIIIYKQFDRLVISQLGKVYGTANDLLINEGVIPKISHSVAKSDSPAQPETSTANNDTAPPQASAEPASSGTQFNELSTLLAGIRQLGAIQVPNYNQYTANPGPQMSNHELLTALSNIQVEQTRQALSAENAANSLHMFVDLILSKSNPNAPQSVQQADEDTINLVAMFFDFILDDQNLPAPFQALISRLQIPVLKVALKDRGFFQNSGHPARKLINTIASTAIGWEAELPEKDKFYLLVAQIIQDIIENYGQDESIFSNKLTELNEAVKQYEHRQALIEKRSKQAAQGKAITNTAKALTQKTILDLLKKATLPPEISQFLIDHWQAFMVSTFIKFGKDSPEWLDATQLIHDLLWACQTQQDAKSIARLEKIKPALMARIEKGLLHIITDDEDRLQLCQQIHQIIEQLQSNKAELNIRPISPAQAQELGHTPGSGNKNWKEMTALERQKAQHQALTYEFIKQAESIAPNTWFDYQIISEQKTVRCKLSARIEANDSYIFVNRFGFNILEKTRKEFAYDLQQKRAKALESTPLFDRAFGNITDNLRQLGQPNRQPTS